MSPALKFNVAKSFAAVKDHVTRFKVQCHRAHINRVNIMTAGLYHIHVRGSIAK